MIPSPLLVGHRGDPAHAPENTLASFRQAIAKGAKAVEMDLRRSRDGRWVVFHDSTLDRCTGRSGTIAGTGWETLRDQRIPALTQVLDLCRRKRAQAFLDVKVARNESSLFQALQRARALKRVMVGAGGPVTLSRWRPLLGETPLFWVTGYRAPITRRRIAQAKRLKLAGLAVYKRWATRRLIDRVHEAGLKLYVWTIRTPRELQRFAALGVDGIMSEVWPPPSI